MDNQQETYSGSDKKDPSYRQDSVAEEAVAATGSAEHSDDDENLFDAEDKFLEGLPRFNVGAFMLPPIWGFGHGMWVTVLFYPAWLFADNSFYSAYSDPSVLSIVLAAVVFVTLTVVTIVFAIVSQPLAAHRAENRGVDRQTYLRGEHRWAIGCVIGGIALLIAATLYNLLIRPSLGI